MIEKPSISVRWVFFRLLAGAFILLCAVPAHAGTLGVKSSSQFLWNNDILGQSEPIIAEYIRFGYAGDGKDLTITGYGRVAKDFVGDSGLRDNALLGRLYYFYADYKVAQNARVRMGRQFVNITAKSAVMDGIAADFDNIFNRLGITAAAGSAVRFGLDKDVSGSKNGYGAVDVHLENSGPLQLGLSFARKYDGKDVASENFGLNSRLFHKSVSPYVELVYSRLTDSFDQAAAGLDWYCSASLSFKGEFYHSYPAFDSTSIYSVFAADKYSEYLLRADYSLNVPIKIFVAYKKLSYSTGAGADVYTAGMDSRHINNLTLTAMADYRLGYGGRLWGMEVYGDYRMSDKLVVSAGARNDSYDRGEPLYGYVEYSAQKAWVGCRYFLREKFTLDARAEENVNQNFKRRSMARVSLNYSM